MDESKNLSKVYDPKQVEEHWYSIWEENKYFAGRMDEGKENFSIVMPPPNVTGKLHMGHAMDNTMQDILVRYKRLCGFNTLWVPGTDHAGIATQAKVEAQLKEEGTNRFEVGREEFLRRTWAWKEEYGNTITTQLRKLGSSCDWDRERFTMDEGCSKAVREAFVRLYDKGLIYQGNYIVNWCPHCQTTISDIEVDHVDQEGKIYYFRYPTEDGTDSIEIATTRPETMMGDTAVAVHPEDERYKHLIGKNLVLPVVNRIIPVVADEYVEKDFGTGAVKITPAHDPNDFEVGSRHNLPQVFVIDKQGKMNNNAGKYAGLDRYECRKQLVEDLTAEGILTKIEEHNNSVGHCYRCNTVIEPLVSKQWFVKMEPLAKPAIEAAHTGAVNFVPERFTKIYLGWLENIRDWCISRQLWWGHRIPVWYCQDCGEVMCSTTDIDTCTKCGSKNVEQDPDVLDTWFSSGLWPFSTMGWPEQTKELEAFYPTSVLVTGRDIIFFWVARMLFDALEFTGQSPFHDVLIHGLVLDSQGRKMSKSLGNCIYLSDSADDVSNTIMRKMYTDPLHLQVSDPGHIEGNMAFTYLDAFSKEEHFGRYLPEYANLDELKEHYQRGGLGDVKVKKFLNNVLQEELEPIRNRRKELQRDIPYVYEVLKKGCENAREVAAQTLSEVRAAMKIDYFDDAAFGRKWFRKVDADIIHGDIFAIHEDDRQHHAVENELRTIAAELHIFQPHQRQGYRMHRLLVVVGDIDLHGQGTAPVEVVFTWCKVNAAGAFGPGIINQQSNSSTTVLAARLHSVVSSVQFHARNSIKCHSGDYGTCHKKWGCVYVHVINRLHLGS